MLEKEISEWIANPIDFKKGIELVAGVSKNLTLIRQLQKRQNHYNVEKIKATLKEYLRTVKNEKPSSVAGLIITQGPIITPKVISGSKPIVKDTLANISTPSKEMEIEVPSHVPSGMTPEEIETAVLAIKTGISRMKDKRGILSNSLENIPSDEERKFVLAQMDDITKSINEASDKIRYHAKYNDLPPLKKDTTTPQHEEYSRDPVVLHKELQNLRSERSKLNKAISENLPEWKKIKKSDRLKVVLERITEIQRRLNHG